MLIVDYVEMAAKNLRLGLAHRSLKLITTGIRLITDAVGQVTRAVHTCGIDELEAKLALLAKELSVPGGKIAFAGRLLLFKSRDITRAVNALTKYVKASDFHSAGIALGGLAIIIID